MKAHSRFFRSRTEQIALSILATIPAVAGLAAEPFSTAPANKMADTAYRLQVAETLESKAAANKAEAVSKALRNRWKISGNYKHGGGFELIEVSPAGIPVYFETLSAVSAISTGSMELHDEGILLGANVNVGIWDQGAARATHQEFATVVNQETVAQNNHTTAVASIIAATGVNPELHGGAPAANVQVFNWGNDNGELTINGAATPADTDKIQISNHSYGSTHGWAYGSYGGGTGWYWFGAGHNPGSGNGLREDPNFGAYAYRAWQYDNLAAGLPYLLPIRAAGNDRDDVYSGPRDGTGTYRYVSGYSWRTATWNPETAPVDENGDLGGYDTIISDAVGKNVLTVGAVTSAEVDGVRTPDVATAAGFSGWGPVDDGRVKPDIVAVGESLRVAGASNDTHYYGSSGTSFSTPAVTAVAAQVVEEVKTLFPDRLPLSSTVKGLLVHGATDIGNPGPDYMYGWGLVDAVGAIEPILHQASNGNSHAMVESSIDEQIRSESRNIFWDGSEDLVVTICWTDAPGTPDFTPELDRRTPKLVNDLDLRVWTPDGTIHLPFRLDPENPAADAVRGDNVVDNIEQVRIPAGSAAAGIAKVIIASKAVPVSGDQPYSLLISGHTAAPILTGSVQQPTGGTMLTPEGEPLELAPVQKGGEKTPKAEVSKDRTESAESVVELKSESARVPSGSTVETIVPVDELDYRYLQYSYRIKGLKEGESLIADFTTDGGETWQPFDRIESNRGWTLRTVPAPAVEGDIEELGLRFRCEAGPGGTRAQVRNVRLLAAGVVEPVEALLTGMASN